jgi:hypothetical protein
MAESKKTSRVVDLLVIFYLVGALFTNAYIREYRWNDWNTPRDNSSSARVDAGVNVVFGTTAGTLFWPVYLSGKGAGWIVRNIPEISVEVKDKQ